MNPRLPRLPASGMHATLLRRIGPALLEEGTPRAVLGVVLALAVFAVFLLASGHDPR